jgi:disulfide oxidoreductase YuzD
MATVKELYDYIKLQIKLRKPITPFHQAIVDAYEKEGDKKKQVTELSIIKKDS